MHKNKENKQNPRHDIYDSSVELEAVLRLGYHKKTTVRNIYWSIQKQNDSEMIFVAEMTFVP
ncbi:MAG: hypothetical protein A2928_01675 [Candidatus Taylorbacteria bacterium RIFCSPLOWO2_01_FULL_45_15b]|uniref:Uncharacterized protein n=1 Tax=Candidatus Taylorbacteria bacterium RIFCSPLOWO2_01_FULL_45_15b TaxID=1802319 RepID=A0A1G2NAX3_9BACT|nr:MAG: hypothetical protein A2928_01675 [Candidatus Taylorbacteria bacterium RIFCSPLOWO2_01_FULL_45_15b]